MDFINDGVVSLDAFISAYKPAALILACSVETRYAPPVNLSISLVIESMLQARETVINVL